MREDKKGRPLCDYSHCENLATRNEQSATIVWSIDKKGNYSDAPIEYYPDDNINEHWCDEHNGNN